MKKYRIFTAACSDESMHGFNQSFLKGGGNRCQGVKSQNKWSLNKAYKSTPFSSSPGYSLPLKGEGIRAEDAQTADPDLD